MKEKRDATRGHWTTFNDLLIIKDDIIKNEWLKGNGVSNYQIYHQEAH